MYQRSVIPIETFFEGLDEARGYLDRHIQEPGARRRRLSYLSRALMRPRGARGLTEWLTTRIAIAIGAKRGELWVCDADWRIWWRVGEHPESRDLRTRNEASQSHSVAPEPRVEESRGEFSYPLPGLTGPIGKLILADFEPLSPDASALIEALCATAGMLLEQSLAAERRDRRASDELLSIDALDFHGGYALRQMPAPNRAVLVFGLHWRFSDEPRGAPAMTQRIALARANLPPGSYLAGEDDYLFGVVGGIKKSRLAEGMARFAGALEGTECRFAMAYRAAAHPVDDFHSFIVLLKDRLNLLSAGRVQQV